VRRCPRLAEPINFYERAGNVASTEQLNLTLNLITCVTAPSTDASLVTSRGSMSNDRWPAWVLRLLVP
jgi:hypothetical protein